MTKFEEDVIEVITGDSVEVMKRRKAEIKALTKTHATCKNPLTAQHILSEINELIDEYQLLDRLI